MTGRGAERIFLHGFAGAGASFDDLIALLPPGAPALVPALLGHGAAGADSFEAEVERLARLIGGAASDPCHLIGYSMGARLGLGLIFAHPELFSCATLVGVHPGLSTEGARHERRQADRHWVELLESGGVAAFVEAWEQLPMWRTQQGVPSERLARQREVRLGHEPGGLAQAMRRLGLGEMPCYLGRLAAIEVPVRLVVGADDEKFCGLAGEMQRENPHLDVLVVNACGHNVVLERPEELAQGIGEFEKLYSTRASG